MPCIQAADAAELGIQQWKAQPTATEVTEPLRVLPVALLAAREMPGVPAILDTVQGAVRMPQVTRTSSNDVPDLHSRAASPHAVENAGNATLLTCTAANPQVCSTGRVRTMCPLPWGWRRQLYTTFA